MRRCRQRTAAIAAWGTLSALVSTLPLAAQAPPRLSLADALARASLSAAVVAARGTAAAESARASLSGRPADPVLGLGTSHYSGKRIVTLSEDLRWAGQRAAEVAVARGAAQAATLDARQVEAATRHLTRQLWFELARAEDADGLAADVVRRARELESTIAARVEGGRAPRLDLVRAHAETAAQAALAASAEQDRLAAWAALAGALQLPIEPAGTTDADRPAMPPGIEIDRAAAATDPEVHPSVAAARARVQAASAAVDLAARDRFPGLSLDLGWTSGDPGLPGADTSASLGLRLPLASGPQQAIAEAELAAARAALAEARATVVAELAAAAHRAHGASATLAAYDGEAIPAAKEAATLTREAWDAGRGDVTRLFEAERALIEVRQARLDAYLQAQLAWADLLLASGSDHAAP